MRDTYTIGEVLSISPYQERKIEEADEAAGMGDYLGVEQALHQLIRTGFPIKKGFRYELLEKLGRASSQ